jgi:hypothetical protein
MTVEAQTNPCDPDIAIIWHEDGSLTVEGTPPPLVAFSPELVLFLRAKTSSWCTIDGDTITMRVCPVALFYRLTGETDLTGGLVAQRMTEEGRVWV